MTRNENELDEIPENEVDLFQHQTGLERDDYENQNIWEDENRF